ncbi:hypothetical protein Pcac1_g2276 [Phytophthora cactorum]|nr:hypothetical protein Pcac1_g2276 [Phytophthora cactorum]KAG2920402.1 hypothetical protein PC114_g6110 [Phytophthora cactorum]KAG3032340.1 hypothetical protein PC119_g5757 [Phytophthora cactorum]
MRASEVASSFGMKESEVQCTEAPTTVSRPSVSASGSRGTFSCRRWRLLSGKPSKDDAVLSHRPSKAAVTQRPTTAAVDSKNWATAATPFAAFLPRETIVPITSRKSVAAAVLTSAFPQENRKEFDHEMAICERKHVKAMGRMATRIYRGKNIREERSESARRQKTREKQTLKDQIYLPVLCQTRTEELRDLSPRVSKLLHFSPRQQEPRQAALNSITIPDSLAGMKLLSSQLDELRASLKVSSRANERTARLWYPQAKMVATQTSSVIEQNHDTDSNSSSIETLLLRVLERPPAGSDGYQADHEENSSDGMDTKSLESRCTNNSEVDLELLLNALDSASQILPQDESSHPSTASLQ